MIDSATHRILSMLILALTLASNIAAGETHWAFEPPIDRQPPITKNRRWTKTAIDPFILATLESKGLQPAASADKRALLRRATYDLTGLPPTTREIDSFLADNSPGAFSTVVNRLLSSPRYGERWGRLWLDVARYADTKGYVYSREERFFVHAWAYRDWVINAFNNDLPYDRFLQLQIAADQLVPPESPDLAAMGFVTGGRRFIGVTREIIDDRIDTVMRGTMGLTVACARCHDHKYDPIPTRDYYSLYGVFDTSADRLVSLGSAPNDEEFRKLSAKYNDTMKKRRDEAAGRLRARVGDYLAAQLELKKYPDEGFDQIFADTDIIPGSVRRWRDFLNRPSQFRETLFAPWIALRKAADRTFEAEASAALQQHAGLHPLIAKEFASAPKSMREAADRYGRLFMEADKSRSDTNAPADVRSLIAFLDDPNSPTFIPDTGIINNEQFFPTSAVEELWKLYSDIDRWLINSKSPPPYALALFDREPEREPRVFIRGNPARQGDEVKRQFPSVLAGKERRPFQRGSGRLELAEAITAAANPLTARVMVNRIWQGHFGAGLVRTPSDFGLRADPPSHPDLLNWLAIQFVKSGWSVKEMHRLIMLSATYQQSSLADSPPLDPENRLLSHFPRARLAFEEMRDSMLAASGELDPKIGGKPSDLFATANKRRTIYGLVDRQFLPTTFRVFDFANPDIHVAQRHETMVPQQALFFLNNEFVADRARALEERSSKISSSHDERIKSLYHFIFQRSPSRDELVVGERFIAQSIKETPPPPPRPIPSQWTYGWGDYDASAKKIKKFNRLPHFNGKAWQGGSEFPDGKLGWAQLTATGGHPGNDLQHAVIRRWTAPADATISISGELLHEPEAGDGIRAYIVSSRSGELKAVTVHHAKESMSLAKLEVSAGDTLDFIVDIREGLNSDQFLWAPEISAGEKSWSAQKDFGGPARRDAEPLRPWAQYAQALLFANEFSFID